MFSTKWINTGMKKNADMKNKFFKSVSKNRMPDNYFINKGETIPLLIIKENNSHTAGAFKKLFYLDLPPVH